MSANAHSVLVSDDYLEELHRMGQQIYDGKLKSLLEPTRDGEYVVIHIDTEDYAVGRTYHEASQAMRARHPRDGRLVGFKIGPEPDSDALAARILQAEMRGGRAK